jgi:predicted Zn-dependent protease
VAALQASGSHAELAQALKLRVAKGRDAAARRRDQKTLARLLAERLGDRSAAIAIWHELYQTARHDAEALDSLATLLEAEARYGDIVALFEGAIGEAAEPRALYRRLAAVHTEHTKDVRAALVAWLSAGELEAATELAESEPKLDDPPLRLELGAALLAAGKADDAVRVLRSQIEQYGDRRPKERALVHSLRARAELAAERPALALAEMKEAAAVDPGSPTILCELGELALAEADLDVADQSFRALLLVALHPGEGQGEPPRRAEIYYRLSEIAERRGESERAQELLTSALDTALESQDESAGLERAVCRSGKDELVLQVLELTQKQAQGPAAASAALLRLVEERAARGPLSESMAKRALERAEELRAELGKPKHKKLGLEAWRPLLELQRRLGGASGMLELLSFLGKRFAKSEVGAELLLEAGELMLELPERRAEGIEILEQALERDPARDDLALRLARVFEADGKLEPALARYEAVAGRQSELQQQALQALARLLEASQAPAERRVRVLEQLLALEQGREASESAERLFELCRELGDREGALRALEAGLAADPGRASLALRFADLSAEAGTSERALAVLERALEKSPDDLELGRRRAAALAAAGRQAEALESLERIHERGGLQTAELLSAIERSGLAGGKRWAMREIALLTESGQRERARQRLNEWLSRNGEDVEALRELGRLCGAERDWPEAVAAYERLLRLESGANAVEAVQKLADACERAGQPERALPELERIDAAQPGQAPIHTLLRRIYTDTKQHEKLARLLALEAGAAGTPAARAELFAQAGQRWLEADMPEQALAALEEARALLPERVSLALSFAQALARAGRSDQAANCLLDAIKAHKSPRDPERLRLFEELARIHLEADELAEAYDVLSQAHRADRSHLRIALMLGLVAFDLDELSVAGNALRVVTVAARGEGGLRAAERSSAYYYLAWMQYLKGSDASARQMAHKAVEEDPLNLEAQKLVDLVDGRLRG